jgi:hypothetical protein
MLASLSSAKTKIEEDSKSFPMIMWARNSAEATKEVDDSLTASDAIESI